ncbi:MAG TPA: pyridoxal-dependent decarboxylase [Solirubrobacteraceae bacterium]|nr:pyridoxal-dependent decarboxylase [Solirubrobacteraceae bacterium]
MTPLHELTPELRALGEQVLVAALERLAKDPPDLGRALPPAEVAALAGESVTGEGLGPDEALRRFRDVLLPLTVAIDHPRYFAFIPGAPTAASSFVELLLSAGSAYGGTWLEGAGTVYAENEALRWLADLAGMPAGAGGCFVQGGTNGNVSALHAAREYARFRRGGEAPPRWRVACSEEVHSSVRAAAKLMDVDVLPVAADEHGVMGGAALREALAGAEGVFAAVATAGTTNVGLIDDLEGAAAACREHDVWLHVDGAYGAAGLCAPSVRARFAGIEHADSLIVDPHKWLFAPFDSCALLYREPARGRAAHRQSGAYLDALYRDDDAFNPSDYGLHLSRRARGIPFWFSLAVHGTDAYAAAVERTLEVTRQGAEEIRARDELELVAEPELSILAFRRHGWAEEDHHRWAASLRESGTAFVFPTTVHGETVARLALVNPRTTVEDLRVVLDTMRGGSAATPS